MKRIAWISVPVLVRDQARLLSGAFKHQPEGAAEVVLGAGSYLMIPAGQRHTSGASEAGRVMFQESTGTFELEPVAAGAR